MTHPDRRRRGRAIRKQRRLQRELEASLGAFGRVAGVAAAHISLFVATMNHFADVTAPTVREVNSMRRLG